MREDSANPTNRIFPDIHIYKSEYQCPCCDRLPPDIYNNKIYHEFFLKWERIRSAWGKPIRISRGGGWRCPKYQLSLFVKNKTSAILSPHFFLALDNDLDTRKEVLDFVGLVKSLYPDMRIGYLTYLEKGMTFVHIDQAYLVQPRPTDNWREKFRW